MANLTCADIRLVHLELVLSLTAEDCLNALHRIFARIIFPKKIIVPLKTRHSVVWALGAACKKN